MSSINKLVIYGPSGTLKRMPPSLLEDIQPKYVYEPEGSDDSDTTIQVAVYEEYEKKINSSLTLTCIIESTPKHLRFELVTTGGRMGFRGSSLNEEQTIDDDVTDYILDFAKRYGLTVQEEETEEEEEAQEK